MRASEEPSPASVYHKRCSATLFIAASVEAEEVARVALPAERGRSDVALGNIIGTVAYFIAFNAGLIALVEPLALDEERFISTCPSRQGVRLWSACSLLYVVGSHGSKEQHSS